MSSARQEDRTMMTQTSHPLKANEGIKQRARFVDLAYEAARSARFGQ